MAAALTPTMFIKAFLDEARNTPPDTLGDYFVHLKEAPDEPFARAVAELLQTAISGNDDYNLLQTGRVIALEIKNKAPGQGAVEALSERVQRLDSLNAALPE